MSKSKDTFANMSVSEWSDIMNSVTGVTVESFDKVEVTTSNNITSILFVNTAKDSIQKKIKMDRDTLLETLAKSDSPFKYIVMGRDDEYQELGNHSLRPFGSIMEAIAYGEQLTAINSRGNRLCHSFLIQPLLKDIDSFELTSEQIGMIRDIENGVLA
jgi:hypothetical protein